ncbi:MAG: gliding motility lipoprotein GldH [Muribaculaceae bacterium]|nr:gliding motility lipoprotein GldH [Muribaculaceae bacterium]
MRALLFLIIAVAAVACDNSSRSENTAFSAFRPVDPDGWRYTDTLTFVVGAPADTLPVSGSVLLTVRHNDAYPYSNIWVEILSPDGKHQTQMELADVYGRWHGRGMGLTFECTDTVLRGLTLARGDTLRLHHVMRADTLAAIEQIGLFFVRD